MTLEAQRFLVRVSALGLSGAEFQHRATIFGLIASDPISTALLSYLSDLINYSTTDGSSRILRPTAKHATAAASVSAISSTTTATTTTKLRTAAVPATGHASAGILPATTYGRTTATEEQRRRLDCCDGMLFRSLVLVDKPPIDT